MSKPTYRLRSSIYLISIIILAGCAGPVTKPASLDPEAVKREAAKQQEIVLQEYLNNFTRLQKVGLPVLHAAVPLCKDKTGWTIGAWFATKYDFPTDRQDAAINLLKMDDKIRVMLVAPGEPAATAGMMPGDEIVSVNGISPPKSGRIGEGFAKSLQELLKTGDNLNFVINRNNNQQSLSASPKQACAYPLNLVEKDEINAFADGENINIHTGMLRFASDDRDLAVVIGHEMAHNAMGHISKQRVNMAVGLIFDILLAAATGINDQGAFGNAAAAIYSQDFESEADYVGLYAVALANVDIDSAPTFWRKMAANKPESIQQSYNNSHPSSPERFLHLEKTVAEIKTKRSQGLALEPDMAPISVPNSTDNNKSSVGFAPK